MFALVSSASVPVTHELAERWQAMPTVPGERPLNKGRLAFLKREIQLGNVIPFRWSCASVHGVEYRVNGGHTSYLFSNGLEPVGTATIEQYRCDSMDDAIRLWAQFDNKASIRTKFEILKTATELDGSLTGIPDWILKVCCAAIQMRVLGPGYQSKYSDHEKARVALKHSDFIRWAYTIFSYNSRCMKTGPMVAALLTYEQDKEAATQFWTEVETGSNPNPDSGSRALERFLLTHSGAQSSRVGRVKLYWDQFADICMAAWTAWREGRPIKLLKLSKDGIYKWLQ